MATIINSPRDPNTLSNYNNFVTTHTRANHKIDFDRKNISGNTLLKLRSITDADAREILLDSSFLNVKNVKLNGEETRWELLPRFEPYGSALKIILEEGLAKGQTCEVDVCQRNLRISVVSFDIVIRSSRKRPSSVRRYNS